MPQQPYIHGNFPHYPVKAGYVRPRAAVDIWRGDKFLAFTGISTLDCPDCRLVTVLTVL
jgi:hypothetical protein